MRLFECNIDGATYWVAAPTLKEAVDLAFADVLLAGGDIGADLTDCSAEESNETRAAKVSFRDDNGLTSSIWEEFGKSVNPGVIACSEY